MLESVQPTPSAENSAAYDPGDVTALSLGDVVVAEWHNLEPAPSPITVVAYGSSDDNFCYRVMRDGKAIVEDEIGCYYGWAGLLCLNAAGHGLRIVGTYSPESDDIGERGCWLIGVLPIEEDVPMPIVSATIQACENTYSPFFAIDLPGDYTVLPMARNWGGVANAN